MLLAGGRRPTDPPVIPTNPTRIESKITSRGPCNQEISDDTRFRDRNLPAQAAEKRLCEGTNEAKRIPVRQNVSQTYGLPMRTTALMKGEGQAPNLSYHMDPKSTMVLGIRGRACQDD